MFHLHYITIRTAPLESLPFAHDEHFDDTSKNQRFTHLQAGLGWKRGGRVLAGSFCPLSYIANLTIGSAQQLRSGILFVFGSGKATSSAAATIFACMHYNDLIPFMFRVTQRLRELLLFFSSALSMDGNRC